VIGFLVFGIAGGVANRRLRRSLVKLDLYDQIDDATGLFNPKFLVLQVDLEAARSRRYQSFFALAVVDIPHAWLDPLGRRRAARVLKDLGGLIAESIRTVDRGIHGPMPQVHRLVVLMPETGPEGAVVFTTRLVDRLEQWLGDEGVKPPAGGHLASQALSFPDDEAEITRLREEFDELDRAQYPAAARA
jgi:GGDEF domain-containing protein